MPAIAPVKTWQATYGASLPAQNIQFISASNDSRRLMYLIKQIMTGVASGAWTVQASSDGSANAGAADYWTADSKLIWAAAGSNHSWIVLRQTGIGTTAEILIDLSNASTNTATIKFAPGGFDTGGSLTAAPTASGGSITLCNNASWITNFTSFSGRLSVLISTDGQCTRVLWMRAGGAEGCWFFEKLNNLVVASSDFGGSAPFFGYVQGTNSGNVWAYNSGLDGLGTTKPKVMIGSTQAEAGVACENFIARWHGGRCWTQQLFGTQAYVASPAAVVSYTTAATRSYLAMLQDLWIIPSTGNNDQSRPCVRNGEHMDVVSGDYGIMALNGVAVPWPAGAQLALI